MRLNKMHGYIILFDKTDKSKLNLEKIKKGTRCTSADK